MSCQDVCMTADYDGSCEFYNATEPRAAKDYQCFECGDVIAKGERYEYFVGKFDGDLLTQRTCLVCVEVREAFYCDGWLLGTLWEDMREQMFDHWNEMTAIDCLAKLETPAAVAKVRAAFAEWHKLWRSDEDLPAWAQLSPASPPISDGAVND